MSTSSEDEHYPITDADVLQNHIGITKCSHYKSSARYPKSKRPKSNDHHVNRIASNNSKRQPEISGGPSADPRLVVPGGPSGSIEGAIGGDGTGSGNVPRKYRRYKMRYALLLMFALMSLTNAFHWIQYAILGTIVESYYRISINWINATSTVYMVSYIIGIIPATLITERYGIRISVIVAASLNAFGGWIKMLSTQRSGFPVAMFAQTIIAFAQLFILNVPPLLAATWFPNEEVPQATAYGVFGNQLGIALGFVIPPLMMPTVEDTYQDIHSKLDYHQHHEHLKNGDVQHFYHPSHNDGARHLKGPANLTDKQIRHIQHGFQTLHLCTALISTVLLALIVVYFKEQPALPPSLQQALVRDLKMQKSKEKKSLTNSMRNLFSNRNFILLFLSYGMFVGVFFALSTVLSQMITRSMGNQYLHQAGYMGLAITLSGIVGSLVWGYILGWTGKFKLVTVGLCIFSMIGCMMFAVAVHLRTLPFLFVSSGVLGFFMTGYLPIGFEFGAEVTYPEQESTSAGYLSASSQIFGLIITMGSSPFLERFGPDWTNALYISILAIGTVLAMMVGNDLRRQNCAGAKSASNDQQHHQKEPSGTPKSSLSSASSSALSSSASGINVGSRTAGADANENNRLAVNGGSSKSVNRNIRSHTPPP